MTLILPLRTGPPPIIRLRNELEGEEFEYAALLSALEDYAYPGTR
ncbi:MAG: hypothetical protein M5U22_09340 [Thermoleophilia bacterium]|nr:hypothetical protein [Thermoleophilia bacterium]